MQIKRQRRNVTRRDVHAIVTKIRVITAAVSFIASLRWDYNIIHGAIVMVLRGAPYISKPILCRWPMRGETLLMNVDILPSTKLFMHH